MNAWGKGLGDKPLTVSLSARLPPSAARSLAVTLPLPPFSPPFAALISLAASPGLS